MDVINSHLLANTPLYPDSFTPPLTTHLPLFLPTLSQQIYLVFDISKYQQPTQQPSRVCSQETKTKFYLNQSTLFPEKVKNIMSQTAPSTWNSHHQLSKYISKYHLKHLQK